MEWSTHQQAIFEHIERGTGHAVGIARAGSGKTTTISEGVSRIRNHERVLVCAFGKRSEADLVAKVKERRPRTHVQTLHAFGRKQIVMAAGKRHMSIEFEPNKMDRLLDDIVGADSTNPFVRNLRFTAGKIARLAKQQLAHTPEMIDAVMDTFGIVTSPGFRDRIVSVVMDVLAASKKPSLKMDFDDFVWLPEVIGLPIEQYDRVFIDETQDMTPAQTSLALKAVNSKTGRLFAIGDDRQSIYGWRGAHAGVLDDIVERFAAKRFPLPVSYRCPRVVVEYAKQWVPDLEAAPNAIEGIRETIEIEDMMKMASPDDFILSRLNAPLVTLALAFIKNGQRARVAGRENGQKIIAFIERSPASSVGALLHYTDEWIEGERERLGTRRRATALAEDLAETIYAVAAGAKTVADCKKRALYLFSDNEDQKPIVLSSIHQAKGLERDRVFLLDGTLRTEQGGEEENLAYVASTRARIALYHVRGFEKREPRARKPMAKKEKGSAS